MGKMNGSVTNVTKKLESISGYRNHMLMHEEDKKKHVCTKCTHRFLYKSQLKRHMESHADGGVPNLCIPEGVWVRHSKIKIL